MSMKAVSSILMSFLSLSLTACFSTHLPALEAPSGLDKLKSLSERSLPLKVDAGNISEEKLGFQYLLVAIPFSRIYDPNIERDAELQFSVAGSLRGYTFTHPSTSSPSSLKLSVISADLDGYDLLFVRKPTASVTLFAALSKNGSVVRECTETGVASDTAHYAFSVELQSALAEALLQASYKILDCLGFNSE
jgi:hypothetical protein